MDVSEISATPAMVGVPMNEQGRVFRVEELAGKSGAELLMAASHAMHSTLYLTELYRVILDLVMALTGANGSVLMLQRPRTHHPVNFKCKHGVDSSVQDLPSDVGREFLDWLKGHDKNTQMFSETPQAVRDAIHSAVSTDIKEMRWVHLTYQGRLLGALGALNREDAENKEADSILIALAAQAAIALENAILYRRAERESLQNQILLESSRLLLSSLDLDEILDGIMDSLQRAVPYNAIGIFLVNDSGKVERIVERGYNPEGRHALDMKAGVGLVGWVASTGEPVVVDDVSADPRYQNARASTQSEMVVPIYAGEHLVGVFNLERDVLGGFYEVDLDLVHAFAQHAGVAIERARMHTDLMEQRRLKGELEVARNIQKNFLPKTHPQIQGYDVAGINIPSEEVGGDYYDFISIIEGQTGIAIADSSGKGIPAALIMAAFRASLIAEIRNNYALHVIMQKTNRLLCEGNEETRFVTALYGVLDAKSRVFTFSNAGHDPGILRRADGSVLLLSSLGTALGIFPDAKYEERVIGLSTGDILLFYTDGVTETENAEGKMFEIDGLLDALHKHAGQPARDILTGIQHEVRAFAEPHNPTDDFTMVVVRVL